MWCMSCVDCAAVCLYALNVWVIRTRCVFFCWCHALQYIFFHASIHSFIRFTVHSFIQWLDSPHSHHIIWVSAFIFVAVMSSAYDQCNCCTHSTFTIRCIANIPPLSSAAFYDFFLIVKVALCFNKSHILVFFFLSPMRRDESLQRFGESADIETMH